SAMSAEAWSKYRTTQYGRMRRLFAVKGIEEKLVDEAKERYEAALEAVRSAHAAHVTAKAQVQAARARILQAQADVGEAEAQVLVAQAEVDKAQQQVDFATITSPYDGVVTFRGPQKGTFVRAGTLGGNDPPLLIVDRIDRVRVVAQVPD